MLRNKEIAIVALITLIAAATGVVILSFFSFWAALVGLFCLTVLILAIFLLTQWRYRQIQELSQTLRRVNDGDYQLQMEENREGELSILKSEIYKTTLTLRLQAEQLEKEKKHLSDSLSDISHQLKTPLTSMFVMTDLLCEGNLTEEKRGEFTGNIRQQLQRMQWLVESLLKFSKLDANAVTFQTKDCDPEVLVAKSIAPLLIPAELKNIHLETKTDHQVFICDLNWTAEALVNILKNCMEHTPQDGRIELSIQTNPLYTRISVKDSGPGFNASDLPYIFERFYKGKNAADEGLGIGLAMARTIVEAQGGTLDARNAPLGGAVFNLCFPRTLI